MSPIKKISFTFIAVVCIPVLFFLLLEGSLRLFGVGTDYDYFIETEINGEAYFQDNKAFANQFYPSSLGIAPLNNTLKVNQDDSSVRVYVLGGSAAQGFPHVNHGLDRHLGAHLRAALPNKTIEIINTAMTSVNSHVVYEVARTLPEDSADYAIILMGNNEVVGPYGPSTFSQNFLPNLGMIRALQAVKRTRIWQAMAMLVTQFQPDTANQEMEWEGMQMFTEFSVPSDDERLADVYSHYEHNLRDIIEILQSKGMHVIVSSVPVNLRHSAPFGSAHRDDLAGADLARWVELNEQANQAFSQQDWSNAQRLYRELVTIDPEYADSHFRLATVLENLRQFDEAKTSFINALEYDTKRFRTNKIINSVIEKVAREKAGPQFSYIDSVAVFDQVSYPYAPGWNLLHEHVHFDYAGNFYLAREFTQAIMTDLAPSVDFAQLSQDKAAEIIGFPNHETNQVMDRLLRMVQQPPFTHQINHADLEAHTLARKNEIVEIVGTPAEVIERRENILKQGLADWKIHYELAELQRFVRNTDAAYYHLTELIRLYPHNHESYIKLAEYLSAKGDSEEAIKYLKQSLYYTRNDRTKETQAIGWIGLNYMKINNYAEGKDYLERITDDYSEQIAATMRAYGALVKYAKENNQRGDMFGYINAAQRYANLLIKQDRVQEFPLLYRRMAQIMTIAGDDAEAQRWLQMQPENAS